MKLTSRFWPLLVFTFVGYATRETNETDLREGNQCFAPQFVTVGENGVKLLDIGFDFSAIDVITGEVKIQRLNKNGVPTDTWRYYKGQTRGSFKTAGWYNGTTRITADNQPTFAAYEGLYLGLLPGVKVTTSGEVLQQNVTVTYEETGNKILSNPYPVGLKLLDIQLGIEAISVITGEIKIQRLNKNGVPTDTWRYYKGQTRGSFKTEGWYNGTTRITVDNQPTFAAGEGLYFGGLEGMTVTFVAPNLTQAAAE